MSHNLNLEQLELLNDSFWLAYILKFIEKVDNIWIKSYISNFMLFFASIYAHELIVANFGNMSPDITMTRKELKDIRMNNIKLLPMENTESIKNKMKDMGIDFEHYVFDMIIICDSNLELFDTNFRMWEYQKKNEEQFENLNAIVNTPLTWTKRFLGKYYEEIFALLEELSDKYVESINKYNFKDYTYPSCKLFNSKLSIDEKIYIMQRYGLIKSVIWLEDIFKEKIKLEIGDLKFDFERFLLKIKAIVIEIIGNDRNNSNYEVIKELLIINERTIDSRFFKINRKMRDNIHYNKINELTSEEIEILKKYQDIYLKNIIGICNSNINIKFNLGYKIALALAKVEYWSRNEKSREV